VWIAERWLGRRLAAARVLSWSSRVAIASVRLELGIERAARDLEPRLVRLIRMKVSLRVGCPFCIDLNTFAHEAHGITTREVWALARSDEATLDSFDPRERAVLAWVEAMTATPVEIPTALATELAERLRPSELVRIAALVAKVNYFARFMHGLGAPAEGFQSSCAFLPPTQTTS
jgi:alkylhydroperoxidase family enzyme